MGGRGSRGRGKSGGRHRRRGKPAPSNPAIPPEDGGGSVKPSPGPPGGDSSPKDTHPQPNDAPSTPGGSSKPPGGGSSDQAGSGGAAEGGGIPAVHWTDAVKRKAVDDHGTPDGLDADIAAVNPGYDRTNRATSENCQRCVAAADMRARGYDVVANPVPQDMIDGLIPSDQSTSGIVARYSFNGVSMDPGASRTSIVDPASPGVENPQDALGMHEYSPGGSVTPRRVFSFLPRGPVARRAAIEEAVTQWGEGSRGVVAVQWRRGGGHVFMVENRAGIVIYYDTQVNKIDASSSLDRAKQQVYTNGLMRVDDLTVEPAMMNWVHNRGGS